MQRCRIFFQFREKLVCACAHKKLYSHPTKKELKRLLVKSDMVDGHGDAVDDPSLADPALPWNRERGDVGGDREQQEEHERGHPVHSFGVLG